MAKENRALKLAEDKGIKAEKTYILDTSKTGEVKIADDVVASIAALAACEVDGVSDTAGNIGNRLMNSVGMKSSGKGVRVDVAEGMVRADLVLMMKYGYNIMETSKKVQDKVKAAIENMTGLTVTDVNIRVASVNTEGRSAQ